MVGFTIRSFWQAALCLVILTLSTPAAAQLSLLNMTKAANQQSSTPPPPPKALLINAQSLGESNYNIVPIADTTSQSLVPFPVQQRRRRKVLQNQLDTLAKQNQRTLQALTALKNNASQAAIDRLTKKIQRNTDSLSNIIKQQTRSLRRADSTRVLAELALRREHLTQLDRLLVNYEANIRLYGDTLKPTDKKLQDIEQFFATYWKALPDAPNVALVFASDSAENSLQYKYLPRLNILNAELHQRYERFKALLPNLKKLRQDLQAEINFLQTGVSRVDTLQTSKVRYNALTKHAQTVTDSLLISFRAQELASERYNKARQDWELAYKTRKNNGKDDNISALPAITSVPGTRLLVPEISTIGSRRIDSGNQSYFLALKLFTALGSATAAPANRERGTERLFIRDASSFGLSADATFSYVPSAQSARNGNAVALLVGGAYLDKLMTPDTTRNYNVGTASFRLGVEVAPVPQALTLYCHLNGLAFLTNRAAFQRDYVQPSAKLKDVYTFLTVGAKAMFILSNNKTTALELDLGFILKGDNVRAFVPNEDLTITTIRATLIKNFSLNHTPSPK
jgi:hypothetical protein